MRLVLQRVKQASVTIDGAETRAIGAGLAVLVGICPADTENICEYMADKMARLRIFDDADDNMNLSLLDVAGECLIISNFTLYAQCRKGRRPSFVEAAPPAQASRLFDCFVEKVRALKPKKLQTGEFGAHMEIDMTCDGPVTILLDSDQLVPKG